MLFPDYPEVVALTIPLFRLNSLSLNSDLIVNSLIEILSKCTQIYTSISEYLCH